MMYAIVDIAGQQFKVEKDMKIFVHRLEGEEGTEVSFDNVLLIDDEEKVLVGEPVLNGALVHAKILNHLKGDKVLVFKKKRRKGFKKLRGHRQFFSQILIEDIITEGGVKKISAKKVKVAEAKAEPEAKVKEVKAEKKPVKKKPSEKKPAVKKVKKTTTETKKAKAPVKKTSAAKTEKQSKSAKAISGKGKGKSAKE